MKVHFIANLIVRHGLKPFSTFSTSSDANVSDNQRLTNNEQYFSFKFARCDVTAHILPIKDHELTPSDEKLQMTLQ